MKHLLAPRIVLCLLSVTLLAGCGGSDSDNGGGSSPAPANTPVAQGSQLIGSWYRANPKVDLLGLEFTSDGKVLLYGPGGQTITFDYTVMDGGRLRMNAPGGQTMLFECKVSDQSLGLTPQGESMISQSEFHRLPSGKTVAQAHQEEVAQIQKQQQEDLATLQQLVTQPKLVIASADSSTKFQRVALNLNGTQGTACFEGPDMAALRQIALSIQPASDEAPAQVTITYGNVLGPIGQGPLPAQTVTLALDRSSGQPVLTNKALSLKSDPGAYDQIVASYQQVQKEREAKIDNAIEPLGAYTHAVGEFAYPNNPNSSFKVNIGLLRVAGKRQFMAGNLQNKPNPTVADFSQPADVQLRGNEVWIVCPSLNFVMQPATDADGKPALKGQYGNYELPSVPVTQVLTQAQLDTINTRIDDFLNKQLPAGILLNGYMLKDGKLNLPCPVAISFKGSGPNLTGVLEVLHMDGAFDLSAQPVRALTGVLLSYKSTAMPKPGPSTLFGRSRNGVISVDFTDATPQVTGGLHGGFEVGPAVLSFASDAELAKQKQELTALLQDGASFTCTDSSYPNRPAPVMTLKLDPSTGKLTGEISKGYSYGVNPGAFSGELKEQYDMLYMDLAQPISADKRIPGGHHVLWVLRDAENHLWLSGWTLSTNSNPPTITIIKFLLNKS